MTDYTSKMHKRMRVMARDRPAGYKLYIKLDLRSKKKNLKSTCMHVCGLHACCQIADNNVHSNNFKCFSSCAPMHVLIILSIRFQFIYVV